ncbi:MAG: phosphatase PAP2 family protein [Bacteroidia bacterium]|nr:phosphatase PAP2 family protein [Bacteroidia bacterium]
MKAIFLIISLFTSIGLYSQNIDIRLLRSINSPEVLPADNFFRFMSRSEAYVVIGVPAGIVTAGLIKDDKEMVRNACVIAVGTAFSFGISAALKYTVNRDRPYETYPDIMKKMDVISPSFPSGHTSSAFETATSLSLAYPEWYVIVPSFAWAGTVAYSRMEVGVHYPSDVLAGALIGAGSAFLTYKINEKLNGRRKYKPCNCP